MKFEKISVIGLGYIGLPPAAMFASCGASVIGVDVSPDAVETINRGDIHIVEPGLDDLVRRCVEEQKLRATYEPEPADAFLIAVPTPFKTGKSLTPEPDLSYIASACEAIAPVLQKGNLIVLESTSPVGTTEQVCKWLSEKRPDLRFPNDNELEADVFVAHCPERVLPGQVLHELVHNDRIVGGITARCSEAATLLYKMVVKSECHVTNARTAEMAKLTENASRDVQIAFANELSMICSDQNINVWDLIALANKHPRVNILQPGPGVGGHCIAIDPWFIVHSVPQHAKLIKSAREINEFKTKWVIEQINKTIEQSLVTCPDKLSDDVTIAVYGLAFKPNIDDLRESPAIKVAEALSENDQYSILFIEPNINELPVKLQKHRLVDQEFARQNADIHIKLVAHREFEDLVFADSDLNLTFVQ